MNYFERLVRRALLRPASAPGAALDDPFANVADWPLELPARQPARPATAAAETPAPAPAVAAAAEAVALSAPAQQALQPVAELPAAPAHFASPPPGRPRVPAVEVPTRGTEAPAPPSPPVVPPREALAIADAFMRGLGVQGQLPELAPAAPPAPPPALAGQASVAAAAPAGEAPAPVQAQVVPPVPPAAAAPASPAAARLPSSPQRAAREPVRESPPRERTVIETRHVVVERKAKARDEAGVSGGGAPRFGLGQL